ncbi:MAG: putative dsRNA-binding protein, partial [Clostridium perfringens]|nr:putative dsRNA-binding protein [Clostridium perfringens]
INNEIMGQGVGFSKKESEQNAAKAALQRLGEIKWEKDTI